MNRVVQLGFIPCNEDGGKEEYIYPDKGFKSGDGEL